MSYSVRKAFRRTVLLTFAALMAILILPRTAKAYTTDSFYGIWCQATKDYNEALGYAEQMRAYGFEAEVYTTSQWTNLNPEKWYAVTAGVYYSEQTAYNVLSSVQQIYPDAYVKYTGTFIGGARNDNYTAPSQPSASIGTYQSDHYAAFYGIWCHAAKRLAEAQMYADNLTAQGYPSKVFLTTEWSNLNSEPWYVVSVGVYYSESSAYSALPAVQRVYNDAYVKYSGNYRG